MAQIESRERIELFISLTLNEAEVRALYELSTFKSGDILQALTPMSGALVRNHGEALCGFLASVRTPLAIATQRTDIAREAFKSK